MAEKFRIQYVYRISTDADLRQTKTMKIMTDGWKAVKLAVMVGGKVEEDELNNNGKSRV